MKDSIIRTFRGRGGSWMARSRARPGGRRLLALGVIAAWLAGCTLSEPVGSRRPSTSTTLPRRAIPPAAWAEETDRWLGTPYLRGGDTRGGVDCSAFVQEVYSRVARVAIPRVTTDQYRLGFEVGRSSLEAGDLVFFETAGTGVSHVGIMVGGDRFAHASTSRGVMYSRLSEAFWSTRYLGARRLEGP